MTLTTQRVDAGPRVRVNTAICPTLNVVWTSSDAEKNYTGHFYLFKFLDARRLTSKK